MISGYAMRLESRREAVTCVPLPDLQDLPLYIAAPPAA